jgi:TolB-like protein/Tfp pilus assembly protein PilF
VRGRPRVNRNAVFLSYASEDAAAAQRIAAALRSADIEVWFDREELRGGDAWDRRIREQIRDCRLFMPVISASTEARSEGYFRREWRLAVERAGDMADNRAFLVPVVIDATSERDASVPDRFRERQWTPLPGGETPAAFTNRVQRLLTGEPDRMGAAAAGGDPALLRRPQPRSSQRGLLLAGLGVAMLALLGYVAGERPWADKPRPAAAGARFAPPAHSIAVLPFVNMSGDKDQEYFSDGLTEELLNSLSRINGLQVAARTSSFSLQGEHADIATVARRLNVAAVLEGSVRRSADTVRITAQLVSGLTGFHIWSETYDRNLNDILKLQSDIATAVASALKVTLLGDEAAKIEGGGTRNPAALDTYLRTTKFYLYQMKGPRDIDSAIDGYTQAIRLDPGYAQAFSSRSLAWQTRGTMDDLARAQADARQAIALAPQLGEGHLALASALENLLDFPRASEEYEQAMALSPGSERVLRHYGQFAVTMGHTEPGLAAARRAAVIDPLNFNAQGYLGGTLLLARRYPEAVVAIQRALQLAPDTAVPLAAYLGATYYLLGDYEAARRSCERRPQEPESQTCLAMLYAKLGRSADAQRELLQQQRTQGDGNAYAYAVVYAQWGDASRALAWLDKAMALHDSSLARLKTDPLLDPLRSEPRFAALVRALRFPE